MITMVEVLIFCEFNIFLEDAGEEEDDLIEPCVIDE